jgi:dipeptidyl aminopeptidase/acylaminoacyl peptidase
MLFTAGIEGGEATPLPVEGSSENPAWSPGWTQLAFQNNQAGNWDIYRTPSSCAGGPATQAAAAAQCAAQRLTDSPGGDLLPAWSPDGRWIAFVSLRDGNPEIYVMAANGWGQTRLTYAPGGDWRPAWLPDSRHLVFTTDRYGSNDIVLMSLPFSLENMDGEPPLVRAVATPADERDPFVNGDGEMLFLSDANGVMQPHAVNLAAFVEAETTGREIAPSAGTAVFADVAAPIGHPSWLADGRVLFAMGGGIYAAAAYSEPQDFVELLPPAAAALHPAAGAPWSKPPLTAVINRPLESTRASSTP